MPRLTVTVDTADHMAPGQAARLAEELETALREREGISLRTGTGRFFVDVVEVAEAAPVTGRRGLCFTRAQVEGWVGHRLSDSEVEALERTLPNSSFPDTVEAVTHEALAVEYRCRGCGRAESACSTDPCPDVVDDRES